jgi:hypothetical protein
MINVSVEVREGDAPFKVAVRAESITRAVGIVEGRHPGCAVRVVFPIDPEEFFAEDPKENGTDREQTAPSRPHHEVAVGGPSSPFVPVEVR